MAQRIGPLEWRVHWGLVPSEVHRWTQLQPYGPCAGHHTVGDVDRVLHIGEQQSGLKDGLCHLVAPDGQAVLEAELNERVGRGHLQVVLGVLFAADLHHGAIGEAKLFAQMPEHDHAAQRRGQCGDQQTMIAARWDTGDRP